MTGDLHGGNSPSMTCKSVLHTPQARTRTSTSSLFGCGIVTSAYSNGFDSIAAVARNKRAFIMSLKRFPAHATGHSLVLSAWRVNSCPLRFQSYHNHHVYRDY